MTGNIRDSFRRNDLVDKCSTGYQAGWLGGAGLGTATLTAATLNPESSTIFYSGLGARSVANQMAAKGLGITIDRTIGGTILSGIERSTGKYLGDTNWGIVSRIFAGNTKGEATVFLSVAYNDAKMFGTIELPLLMRNGVNVLFY